MHLRRVFASRWHVCVLARKAPPGEITWLPEVAAAMSPSVLIAPVVACPCNVQRSYAPLCAVSQSVPGIAAAAAAVNAVFASDVVSYAHPYPAGSASCPERRLPGSQVPDTISRPARRTRHTQNRIQHSQRPLLDFLESFHDRPQQQVSEPQLWTRHPRRGHRHLKKHRATGKMAWTDG